MRSLSLSRLLLITLALVVTTPALLPTVQAQSSSYRSSSAATPRIEAFGVEPVDRLSPGTELMFTLLGSPRSQVSLTVQGVQTPVKLEEVRPGEYEGAYTLKTRDRVYRDASVIATLKARNGRSTRASLAQPLLTADLDERRPRDARLPSRRVEACDNCGVVEAVEVVDAKGEGGLVGMIGGGVAGGLLGSQIGKGSGRTAAQIAGAIGGAYAGREIEGRVKTDQHYEVLVRFQDGRTQTVQFPTQPGYQVGDRVRLDNGTLTRR